jgi:hypothetical protein
LKLPHLPWRPALLAITALFCLSCENGIGSIGEGVLPPEDIISIGYADSFPIHFETRILDSSDTYRASRQLFGNYIDPQFGRISATTYTQFLSRQGLDFGDPANLIFDSLMLRIDVGGYYGRASSQQTLRVHLLTESFPQEDLISSRTRIARDESRDLAGGYRFTLPENGATVLNLRLDDALGKRLLFGPADSLGERSAFVRYFPGLSISTDPVDYFSREPGAIVYMIGAGQTAGQIYTELQLFYQRRDSDTSDFRAFVEPFIIANSTPRFSHLERSEVGDKLLSYEAPQPDTRSFYEFLQGGLLVHNYVRLEGIERLGQVAISRADLVLRVDTSLLGSQLRYAPPLRLVAVAADENGQIAEEEEGVFELIFDASDVSVYPQFVRKSASYTIPLARYVQEILGGQRKNYGFFLIQTEEISRLNRVVWGGTEHPALYPELKITYSTLPR